MTLRVAFVIGQYPPDQRKLREDTAKRYASADVEVGILSVPLVPFNELLPAEQQQAAPYFHQAFCQAEKEGYDAVVPLGMLDLGVEGGRSLVDIPVVAPYQASLHIAANLGDRIGVISYTSESTPKGRVLTRNYGMEHFIAGYADSSTRLRTMADRREQMQESFIAAARKLIDEDGADVIIPRGITQCPVHMDPLWLSEQIGVPVVEGIGAAIRFAAMLAGLGLRHSRKRWPKSNSRPAMPGMEPL
jgi:allantoin racemase